MDLIDQASFRVEMLTGNNFARTNMTKIELQLLFLDEIFALSNIVTNKPYT